MPSAVPPAIPFTDRAVAARSLALLYEAFITSGSVFPVDRFARAVEGKLSGSPDPDLALVNLRRFVESSFSRASLFNDLVQHEAFLDLLVRLFGSSRYLADILVREPELFRWLTGVDVASWTVSPGELTLEFRRLQETFPRPERALEAIKRAHRRAILRIGAQDILGTSGVASVTAQLSDLAEATIEAVLGQAVRRMQEFAPEPAGRFVVLALGKLGGGELNFSSDIDVLFLYDEEGPLSGPRGRESSRHEYYNKLSELLVRLLSQATAEGYLYRVDTRLRPESGAGPLARSLRSYMTHYEARGELWERQMLIKARPVAGDLALGREFLAQLTPFIYPRTFFLHPVDAIARMKARIEAKIGDRENIKLRPGGIRDIEFVVQALQLLNGGKHPRLREHNTLRAIGALTAGGFLSEEESLMLCSAYALFRTVEHRLQIMANTQTHTIPGDPATLTSLARSMGFAGAAALTEALGAGFGRVRRLFDQVMSVPATGQESGIHAVIDGALGEEEAAKVLRQFNLADVRSAARAIRSMTGTSLTGQQDLDARTREVFRGVAPDLFREIAGSPDPDLTIRDVAMLASAQPVPRQLYDALGNPPFRRLLVTVASLSPRLTRELAQSPLLLDAVITDVHALELEGRVRIPSGADIAEFKNHRELLTGLRYVLGLLSFEELTSRLTALADAVVGAVFRRETRAFRTAPLAVFALGKFGTLELGFNADLDLLFVSGPASASRRSRIEGAASALMSGLSAVSEKGRLYDVDARLRPEGRNAPLLTDVQAYGEYLRRRASLWERQALVRSRFVCGSRKIAGEFTRLARSFVFETPLPPGWASQIAAMRRKMETRSRTRGEAFVDIKLGAGGMADIEFMVQMIQLRFGATDAALRFGSTPALLGLPGLPGLEEEERTMLRETYLRYRKIEALLRLTLEERTSVLPEGARLQTLARCVGREDAVPFRDAVEERMKSVRATFHRFCRRLETHEGEPDVPLHEA